MRIALLILVTASACAPPNGKPHLDRQSEALEEIARQLQDLNAITESCR